MFQQNSDAEKQYDEILGRFPERAARLHKFIARPEDVTAKLPLMVECRLRDKAFADLQNALRIYLFESLMEAFPDKKFDIVEDPLLTYADHIVKLPNLTPNGLLLPKYETFLSFNLVHKVLGRIVEMYGLDRHSNRIHLPANIRVVSGMPDPSKDSRPRASTKLHSDIWAGESTNSIMVFIPAFGDMRNVGIENIEPPVEFRKSFLRPLEDYVEGACLEKEGVHYPVDMKLAHLYLTDTFLLHRTLKRAPGLRLSIDFRVRANDRVESDIDGVNFRDGDYVSNEMWKSLGFAQIAIPGESLLKRYNLERSGGVKNEYATKLDLIKCIE